jgi:hypothetical protein
VFRKPSFLISLILVLGLFNVHSAYAAEVWWSDQSVDANNHLWNGPNNWVYRYGGIGDVVGGNEPNSSDTVYIGKGVLEAYWPPILNTYIIDRAPVIDSNVTATCYALWGPCGSHIEGIGWYWGLKITGGSLTIGDMNAPEWSTRWEIAGTDGAGDVNMDGGVVNVAGDMTIGNWGGIGDVNMTDGEINVKWALCMPGTDSGGGENTEAQGTLKLYGGTIRCGGLYMNEWVTFPTWWDWSSEWMSISTREPIDKPVHESTIDLSGGTLIIDGSYAEIIANFIADGYITVYAVDEGDIAPDGRRAYVKADYDEVEDTTTVTGATADLELAYNPRPVHYSRNQPINVTLSWLPGDGAVSHDVYLGTSFDDVNDADTSDLSGIYRDTLGASTTSYNPPEYLTIMTTYYWRIDEFDGATKWKGRVWCFTVANHRIVDSFDSYSTNQDLWEVWKDYWTIGTGAEVLIQTNPKFEPDGHEMEYGYDSADIDLGSEAEASIADLGIDPDWTTGGVTKSLLLYFYGDSNDNSVTENDRMYVAVEDTNGTVGTVPYDGDATDVNEQEWHEWNIDLQHFIDQGVDLTNVAKLYIGFGGPRTGQTAPGGDGIVYFNDIKIYPPRCVPDKAIADVTGDCVVGTEDLGLMAEEWLGRDRDVIPAEPDTTGLVAWYEFEDSYNIGLDSSGNELHGDPCGDATIIYDPGGNGKLPGNVLLLDGTSDYINCGSDPNFDITGSITLACWIKVNAFDETWNAIVTRGDNSYRLARNNNEKTLEFCLNYLMVAWLPGTVKVDDGQWHHVIGVYEHNVAAYLYIDGVVDVFFENGGNINISEHDVCIGCNFGGGLREWNGWIDDVRIYSRALSQAEILYLSTDGTNTDPYYNPLDSPANLYDEEPQYQKFVNFRDYAIMADSWLEQILWP